ncbi:MAG: hypothetical protein RI911_387 [Candidatus Parcubacteria bacterium]|jgi:cysteine desulfurase
MKKRIQKRIYMDTAAAAPISAHAQKAMLKHNDIFANPGAPHSDGLHAKSVLDDARARIAKVAAVKPHEIIFCSGATEANNLVIFGVVDAALKKQTRPHVIVSAIEHSSVLEVVRSSVFQKKADVTFVQPDEHGCVRPLSVLSALTPNTCMVSIGWANGEIGTMQQLRSISQVIRAYEKEMNTTIVFHTDAGQAPWAAAPQPHGVGVDCAVFSSTKLYGPRGVAALFVRKGSSIEPSLFGGSQERGLRPGTEDPVLAIGFAAAFEEGERLRAAHYKKLVNLRIAFAQGLHALGKGARINGTHRDQLPHLVNVSFPGIDSEYVMYALDHAGVSISTKSICLLEEGDPVSPVVAALGGELWRAQTTLRFSFSRATTMSDVKYVLQQLKEILSQHQVVPHTG